MLRQSFQKYFKFYLNLPQHTVKHIVKSKKGCRAFYGSRFNEIKKENNKKKVQRFRNRNGIERELKNQRDAYANNPEKKEKKQNYYQENRESLSKEYRDKAREAKKDSSANDAKYREAIKFGPLFICVCCHSGLFKQNVKVFTETLKEKIDRTVLDSWILWEKAIFMSVTIAIMS